MISADSHFTKAVHAYHQQDFDSALQLTEKASAAQPESLFYQQAELFLQDVVQKKSSDVYASPEGFEAFIRGGGNIPLYTNTSAQLNQIYTEDKPSTVLDIGVGDGHALLPALSPAIERLDCVEPSAAMLTSLGQKLEAHSLESHLHPMTWQAFRDSLSADQRWQMIQMTFSAHTFLPEDRSELFGWCAEKGTQLVIVEFDVPVFGDMLSAEVIGYYVEKYELGLAEYRDQEIVMQRFLMPVFFGNFAHDSQRLTFEQPAANWQAEVQNAGFSTIQKVPVYDYWWGPAFLLKASQ